MPGDYMKSFKPDAPGSGGTLYMKSFRQDAPDPQLVAHGAADATPDRAALALNIAQDTGMDPSYVAQDLAGAKAQRDRVQFAAQLQGRPAMTAWAAQSPQHAAALKDAAGPVGTIEGWFSGMGDAFKTGVLDIMHAEAMREHMGSGGPLADKALAAEEAVSEYDAQPHGFAQDIARAVPQMVMYGAAARMGGGAGLAGLLYTQNKGVLARQIQLATNRITPDDLERPEVRVVGKDGAVRWKRLGPESPDTTLTPEEVDKYATAGSLSAAVTLAGLLGPLVRSLPGVRSQAQATVASVLQRAAMTTVGQAAVRALAGYGAHTMMGALGMTLQATINSATVQKAASDKVDVEQLGREGVDTFLKVLPIAATFAAYGPGREFLEDRARINGAPLEQAKMNAMVEAAKAAKLAPGIASDLFGAMGRGVTAYVDRRAAAKMKSLTPEAVAAAEVAQGDVAVPMSDYLAHLLDEHEGIRDFVKLSPDGYNMEEARARDKEMRQALGPDAEALLGKKSPDELLGLDKTQESPPVPPEQTQESLPLHELMAKEYGGKAEQWAKMLNTELMGALNEEGSVGAVSPEEHAARLVEAMPVGQIKPEPFQRLARRADKYIQEAAEKARTGSAAGAKASSAASVAVLHTYEMARDVNQAKAKKAAEVQTEMADGAKSMAERVVDPKVRSQMMLAGPPVLHLFDALTEGASISPRRQGWKSAHDEAVAAGAEPFSPEAVEHADARMAGALDEARQWFDDTARPVPDGENFIRDFLAKPKPWADLTPAEARTLSDWANQLVKSAKQETTIRSKDRQATVREGADEIGAELRQNPSKGLPKMSGIEPSWWEKRLLDANAANAVQLRPKNNLRQKSEAAVRWIFDRINDALYVRNDIYRAVREPYQAAFEAMPKEVAARRFETYDLSAELPTPDGVEPLTAVPRKYLWKLAQHRMSQGNMDRVISTSGWDKSTIDTILFDDPKTKLTVPEWDYLQSLADVKEKVLWPLLRDHLRTNYGQELRKTAGVPFRVQLEDGTWKDYAGGYEPLKRDARPGFATQPEPTRGIAAYWGRDFELPSTPGAAKERINSAHYAVNMDWDSGLQSVTKTAHWLALDQPVRDVAKLLNDPQLTADMDEFMGKGRADMTRGWLKSVATQQVQSVPEGMEVVAKAFGWQRKLQLMQIVGGSGRLALAQVSHPFGLMLGGEINPVHGVPALLSVFKPFTMADGELRLMPNWNDAIEHGKEVQKRADNAYASLRNSWDEAGRTSAAGPFGAMRDAAKKTAGLYLHAVDRLTTTWAWTAAHNEAVAGGAEPFSPEAVAYADGKTQDVMPAHDETAAPVLTNRQVGGFLIMHGFKNTLYNMRQDALAKSVRELHQAEGGAETGSAVARTAGRVALQAAMFGGFAIMGKLALGSGQQKDETKGQWLGRDFLAGQTADVPFIGGFGEPLGKVLSGIPARLRDEPYSKLSKHDFTVFGNPGVAAVVKAQELLGNLTNGGREDYKKVADSVEAALFFLGVPSRAPRVTGENLYRTLMGEDYDESANSLGRYVYTEKQWDSIRRSLTPDED